MNDHDIELLLSNMSRPQVVAGPHRADLKARLLESAQQPRARVQSSQHRWMVVGCCGASCWLPPGGRPSRPT